MDKIVKFIESKKWNGLPGTEGRGKWRVTNEQA